MNNTILKTLRQALKAGADEKTRQSGQRFFKEPVKLYGLKAQAVRKIAKEHFTNLKGKTKNEVFDLCEPLWKSGYLEEITVACEWIYRFRKEFQPGDFERLEMWINQYVTNWAACDAFCNHTVGTFLEMYPKHVIELKRWAKSDNLWLRRAAAVSLIIPARKGLFHKEIFLIAKILLHDEEDLVQKGYGWMLKSAADSDQDTVFQFVMSHKATMPRTALRYAIEKMPDEMRKMVMGKEISPSPSAKICKPTTSKKKSTAVPHLPQRYAWVDDYCLSKPGCVKDYKEEWDATRYMLDGKFFALLGQGADKTPVLTLKLEPNYGKLLRLNHKEITPGYYMNKLHWNSVSLQGDFPDDLLKELIDKSYKILLVSFSKKKQQAILENSH